MKKTIFLFSLFAVILIAGCNQKDLISQIDGTWHISKYAVNGVDETSKFDSTQAGFLWTFANGNVFSQAWQSIKIYTLYTLDTVAHYDTATHAFIIDSVTTSIARVPTGYGISVTGSWYLTNGNHFLQTEDSVFGNQQYQIIDHSKNSLHLLNGNKDYYLSK
jgi:hypothetical protein